MSFPQAYLLCSAIIPFIAGCELSNPNDVLGLDQHVSTDPLVDATDVRFDLGVLRAGTSTTRTFPLKNPTSHVLTFETFKATCSCTGLRIDKRVLEPGETCEIEVDFRAADRTYDPESKVTVQFTGVTPWESHIHLAARVRRPLALSVSSLVWSGVGLRQLPPMEFAIRNYSDSPWGRLHVSFPGDWLDLTTESTQPDEGSMQTWSCKVRPRMEALGFGGHSGFLKVEAEGSSEVANVPVKIDLVPPVSLVPDRLFYVRGIDQHGSAVDLSILTHAAVQLESPEDFVVSCCLGSIRPEVVRLSSGWVLRCHVIPHGDVTRGEFHLHVPSLNVCLTVPVFVSASPGDRAI